MADVECKALNFDEVVSHSSRVGAASRELESRQKELADSKTVLENDERSWQERLSQLRGKIERREYTTGVPLEDYALVNLRFVPLTFERDLKTWTAKVNGFLVQAGISRTYWQKNEGSSDGRKREIYELAFLQEQQPWTVESTAIRLNAEMVTAVTLEKVFSDSWGNGGGWWPFVEHSGERTFDIHYNDAQEERLDLSKAGAHLAREWPNVAAAFVRARGAEVSSELAAAEEEKIREIAKYAVQKLEEQYDRIRKSDKRIDEIAGRVNTREVRAAGQFATQPVVYDNFLAAIDSAPFRDERKLAYEELGRIFGNLKKTGLLYYQKPVGVDIRAGKQIVYRIPEFALHIMRVLEERISSTQKELAK